MSKILRLLLKPAKKYLKPILPVVMVAVVFAMFLLLIAMSTGLLEMFPTVTIPVIGTVLLPTRVVFLAGFLIGLVVGGTYLFYRSRKEAIHEKWGQYSTWAKAMIIGCVSSVVAVLALGVAYAFGMVAASHLLIGVLVTWPLVVGIVLLGSRRSTRADSTIASVKTGYTLTRGLESRTLSIIIGVLVAIAGALLVRYAGAWYWGGLPLWVTMTTAGLLWVVVTLVVHNRYEKSTVERTDLVILDLGTPESREGKELLVKNFSGRSIDLTETLIRDTDLDLYRPGIDFVLKPGQRGTFEISDSFSLEPNDDAIELPLGYNLKRGGETPAIFTKDGEIHYLQWTDGPAEAIGRESSKHVRPMDSTAVDVADTSGSSSVTDSPVTPSPQD